MLLIKKNFLFLILFFILNFAVKGSYAPFYNVVYLLIPFNIEAGKLIIPRFLLTMTLVVSFISLINKYIDEQFGIFNFILTRINQKSAFILTKYTFKKIIGVIVVKILTDLFFARMSGSENFDLFIWLTLSTVLTCLIWAEIFFLLKLHHISSKIIYLSLVLLVSISILFGNNFFILTIFVPATFYSITYPVLMVLLKFIFFLILLFMNSLKLKKIEYVGDNDYD